MVHLPLLNKGDTSLLGALSSSFYALFVVPGSNMSSSRPLVLHKWGPSALNQRWITARLHVWLFMGGHFRTQLTLMQSGKKRQLKAVIFGVCGVRMWDLYAETSAQCKCGSRSGFYIKPPGKAHTDTLLSPFPRRAVMDFYRPFFFPRHSYIWRFNTAERKPGQKIGWKGW